MLKKGDVVEISIANLVKAINGDLTEPVQSTIAEVIAYSAQEPLYMVPISVDVVFFEHELDKVET